MGRSLTGKPREALCVAPLTHFPHVTPPPAPPQWAAAPRIWEQKVRLHRARTRAWPFPTQLPEFLLTGKTGAPAIWDQLRKGTDGNSFNS